MDALWEEPDYRLPWWFLHYRASVVMPAVAPWEWDPCEGEDRAAWLWRVGVASAAEAEAREALRPKT